MCVPFSPHRHYYTPPLTRTHLGQFPHTDVGVAETETIFSLAETYTDTASIPPATTITYLLSLYNSLAPTTDPPLDGSLWVGSPYRSA